MLILLDLSPLLSVVILLASGRVGVLAASFVSLFLTFASVAVTLLAQAGHPPVLPFLLGQTLRGSWLAWQAIALMIGGFFYFECLGAGGAQFSGALAVTYRRIFLVTFVLGPFFEASTGFGVGLLLTLGFLRAMGLRGPMAVMLGLYSQVLAPWGALALGMVVGSHIAGVALGPLSLDSAFLMLPLLAADLVVFWRLAPRLGLRPGPAVRLEDAAWLALGALGLLAGNRFLPVELALVAPYAVLVLLLLWRTGSLQGWRDSLPATGPYVAVTALLLATRLLPGLPERLRAVRLAPFVDGVAYEPLYNPSFWLVMVGLAVLARPVPGANTRITELPRRLGPVLRRLGRSLWRPGLVTILFLIVAQLLAASGIAATLALRWYAVAGPLAIVTSPVLPALVGFLSASNTASNSMLMPVQTALAAKAGMSAPWLAALQNVSGGQFCIFSPIRIAMGCTLLADGTRENAVYREGWLLAVLSGVLLLGEAALLLL